MTEQKQPAHQTQRKQFEIANDIPFLVKLGSKMHKVRYMKGKSRDMISYLHVSQKIIDSDDPKEILKAMRHNERIHAKVIAVMLLNSFWRIKLFYWIYWRWIFHTYSEYDFFQVLPTVMEANGNEFFFQNTVLLSAMNTLKMRMTKEEAERLLAEPASEKKPVSSKSSE